MLLREIAPEKPALPFSGVPRGANRGGRRHLHFAALEAVSQAKLDDVVEPQLAPRRTLRCQRLSLPQHPMKHGLVQLPGTSHTL